MPLAEALATIATTGIGVLSGAKDLADFLSARIEIEEVLTALVASAFVEHLPRLKHLCLTGEPKFDDQQFCELLRTSELSVQRPQDLQIALLPLVQACVRAPEMIYGDSDVQPIYQAILQSAVRGMWKHIGQYDHLSNEIILTQNTALLTTQGDIADSLKQISSVVQEFASFSRTVWQKRYDRLLDSAPPAEHEFDEQKYLNPFLLARAEDFNHNYEKLARLFQHSPEWDAIQRRTENVFIEGGRGTGKSMLLRRLTAQAVLTARRLSDPAATLESIPEDYFGVYIKFTRGYYEQLQPADTITPNVSSLLAQHELNIEIFDAFTNALSWLISERAVPSLENTLDKTVADLQDLFPNAPRAATTLEGLRRNTIQYEQNQLLSYYRAVAFSIPHKYEGSARDTVAFVRELSAIFRRHLSRRKEMRLFLLVDEFESLLVDQQVAFNTVMKMRLPDLSLKVAVRRSGRKTSATFTKGDPIQKPRDYTIVPLDYDVNSSSYRALLEGICRRRLNDAGYNSTDLREYLVPQSIADEVKPEHLDACVSDMWASGNRRTALNDEFKAKYAVACAYRVHAVRNTRKSFAGFDSYVLLSSGIVSTFIELCKYTFFLALNDQLPLRVQPRIPTYLQTDSVYLVSERLLDAVEGNVEHVGSQLAQLLSDLGSLLRLRLLHHPSEPEANRLSIVDYSQLDVAHYKGAAQVLDAASVWSVLHIEEPVGSYRPRNKGRPPQVDAIINRIYCPALGISPRARWRTDIAVQDLQSLMNADTRESTYARLSRVVGATELGDSRQFVMFPPDSDSKNGQQLSD